jgi:hypothetical protein
VQEAKEKATEYGAIAQVVADKEAALEDHGNITEAAQVRILQITGD